MIDKLNLVVCVPSAHRNFPEKSFKSSGNTYTESTCDVCTLGIWLGTKSAQIMALNPGYTKVCAYCAFIKFNIGLGDKVVLASDLVKVKGEN